MTNPSPAYVEGVLVLAQDHLTDDVYRLTVETATRGAPRQFHVVPDWEREPLLACLDEGARAGLIGPPLSNLSTEQSGDPP